MPANSLTIQINGDTKDFQNSLNNAQKATKGLQEKLTNIAKKSAMAFAGLAATIGGLVYSYREQEVAEQKLTAVLKSTGGAAGMTKEALIKMANELQKVTLFGDETTIAAQALLLTFTKIGQEVFPDAILAAMNMSAALGTDLNSQVMMLGKALNSPIEGVNALKRQGVELNDSQKKLIKTFVDLGDVAGAQKIILGELSTQFAGQAKAAAEGTGRIIQLQGAIGDLGQAIGKGLVKPLSEMADWLNKILLEILAKHGDQISKVAGSVLLFGANLTLLTSVLAGAAAGFYALRLAISLTGKTFINFGKGLKTSIVGGILVGLSWAITKFQQDFDTNMKKIILSWDSTWTGVIGIAWQFVTAWRAIKKKMWDIGMNLVELHPKAAWEAVKDIKNIVVKGMTDIAKTTIATWEGFNKGIVAIDKRNKAALKAAKDDLLEGGFEKEQEWNLLTEEGQNQHYEQMRILMSDDMAARLSLDEEFNELMGEKTNEQRTKILEDLATFQLTKKELEHKDTLARIKRDIKEKNDELIYEQKHKLKLVGGQRTYYKTMKFLDNSRLKEAGSFASQFNAMATSKNKELRAIAKVAANVQIVSNTASAASGAMEGAINFFGVPAGPIIGAVLAAAQIAFGVEQIHRLNAQKLADGGIVSGGISGVDSVPAMLMPGELVVPKRNAEDALNSIGASRDEEIFGDTAGATEIIIGFDGEEASQVLTAKQIENQALGISREEAA